MKKWSVPFITETTDIWEVEAGNKSQATMIATLARQRFVDGHDKESGDTPPNLDAPTHSHQTKFQLGTIRETVGAEALTRIAGGSEHAGQDAPRRIKDQPQA